MFRAYVDNLRKETNDARRSREESARLVVSLVIALALIPLRSNFLALLKEQPLNKDSSWRKTKASDF